MSTRKPNAVLRQKAAVGREAFQARAMSPSKALRLALTKSADELFDLPLVVTGVKQTCVTLGSMLSGLSDETLLVMLDGPEGALGVMTLDIQILAGLIEMQTTGLVVAKEALKRPPTRTDAAMVAPLVDAFLTRFEENLVDEPDGYWVEGFRFGVRADDLRMLELTLEAPEYNVFRMNVDMFGGAKTGEIAIIMPVKALPPLEGETAHPGETIGMQLGEVMMQVPTEINAVLHRLTLPLSAVSQLKVGQILEIPGECLADMRLETSPKKLLVETSLGQLNGFRAVRLNGAMSPLVDASDAPKDAEPESIVQLEATAIPEETVSPRAKANAIDAQNEKDDASIAEIMALPDLPDLPGIEGLPDLPPMDMSQDDEMADITP